MSLVLVLSIILGNCLPSQSANILILEELPSLSHHLWFRVVTLELINRGHNVTVVSSDFDTIELTNLHQIHMEKVYSSLYNSTNVKFNFIEMGTMHPFIQILPNILFATKACEGHTISKGWQQLENYPDNFKFDLVIHDFPASSCLLAFLPKFNYPPLIGMTAFSDSSIITSMIQSALIPSTSTHFLFKESMSSSFYGRLQNFILNSIVYFIRELYLDQIMDKMVQNAVNGKYEIIPIKELRQSASLVLINYNEVIDGMEQLPPNVVGVGGLQIQQTKKLSMDLDNIANNAKNGLILLSLGTNVKSETLGVDIITQILNAFERLPEYTFLWKIDLNLMDVNLHVPSNVYIRNWVPQNDILGHENTKLFITHGGLLSTQEAIYNGVPMLGIPIMVDQFLNIDKSVQKGIAQQIPVKTITSDTLFVKLNEMMSNPLYRENMKVISRNFKDQKESPIDRAIWWIEWTIRNPRYYMMNSGIYLNFFQIQSIDVISALTVVVLLLIYIVLKLVIKLFNFIFKIKSFDNKIKND